MEKRRSGIKDPEGEIKEKKNNENPEDDDGNLDAPVFYIDLPRTVLIKLNS